ncbi:MAG: putative DNA-binding domain-containing protein [Parasphingorhabdus sp.]
MPSLAESQSRFIECLQKGPDHLPVEMFTESANRALLGMKAHANTISHARLVALENAYPKLHEHMGHEEFHSVSRDYIDQDHILLCDMNTIAEDFARFLEQNDMGATEVDLAKVEWAWLESYRATEAEPVMLEDIVTLDEDGLLALSIDRHPAVQLIQLSGKLSPELAELGDETPHALLVARPEAQVLFHPLSMVEHQIAKKIANISTMGNLLEKAIELVGKNANAEGDAEQAMPHLIRLIQTGALMKKQESRGS